MKVMLLWVKSAVYASGDKERSLQVAGTALAEGANEGVITILIYYNQGLDTSGSGRAPAFGTASIIVRDLTSVSRPWPACHMLRDARRNAGLGLCMCKHQPQRSRNLQCNADFA